MVNDGDMGEVGNTKPSISIYRYRKKIKKQRIYLNQYKN